MKAHEPSHLDEAPWDRARLEKLSKAELIEMAWLWVMCALSFPKIRDYFIGFKTLRLSSAGISKIMIRLSNILQPVYAEILNDVRQGAKIWADETGWRVKGRLWWLWIFANERSAYNWADASRGGASYSSSWGRCSSAC